MGLFKEIAIPLASRGVPLIPLRPKTKAAFIQGWETEASTDLQKIEAWDEQYPDANGACVAFAQPGGTWFLEIDQEGYAKQIEAQTGRKIPETFMVRSSPGRGHFYFRQTPASIAMGNTQGKDSDGKEAWSARVSNRYVVAPGSYHPTSGKQYEILRNTEILEAPDWLVQWCASQNGSAKTGHVELDDESPIVEGSRNNALTSILGKARQVLKMDAEQLFAYGVSVNQKRCNPPMSESEVRTIAYSVARYAISESVAPLMNGVPVGTNMVLSTPVGQIADMDLPEITAVPYPVFPRWVMKGTSVFDGFVDPICKKNSRYPEFMFMPAVTLILNYLALKVRIEYKNTIPSIWMVSIGRKGRVIKSSSVQDAVEYLNWAGIAGYYGGGTRNAEGRSLVWTAGSTEGLGLGMSRTNCRNAVLFYDELGNLTSKAGIENSSMSKHLLTMYESGQWANEVKKRNEAFSFEPGSYCASIIACTTDKNFHEYWSVMSGASSGMDERFFFLYQPETLIELIPQTTVNTKDAALETRKRIDKAVQKGIYSIDDMTPLEQKIGKLGNRPAIRVEKFALYFAVDLGRDSIDEECIERGLAICEYELAVKKYLATFEATTREGKLQNEIVQILQRNGGRILSRDLERAMHPLRHGTSLWFQVYSGLIRNGWMLETGNGTKGDPKMVILARVPEVEDE